MLHPPPLLQEAAPAPPSPPSSGLSPDPSPARQPAGPPADPTAPPAAAPAAPASAAAARGAPAGAGAAAEFLAVFERQLSQCRRYGQPMAVLAVRIERLAALEGAPAEGLQAAVSHELWNRLRARTRAKDTVTRVSEQEFAVLLPGCRVPAAAGACARLATALGGVYALGPGPVLATVALGLANLGADGDTAALLWQAAVRAQTSRPGADGAADVAGTPSRRHEQAGRGGR